ncbi:chitobiase/beta-hexosaminidase C-terminal domain-containing protein [Chitinivibrio alkaliphilus]|uniref:Uncharacterized protein n=1 Tax=Chitinivibrio alkaliphilus ACht1 TaxID=1313304 RepID=U7DB94_9BACT|nr:chitobiase/beta-hexosaminidase C-terminal domain-containing protein [Chitinivibrio alkaliphilus]ERP38828.1 hypothetical protein CALK_0600 [Chitinivibrio alkaliphilus ACht1]
MKTVQQTWVLLLLLCFVGGVHAVSIDDLNLAIIWNQNTTMDKAHTPYRLWRELVNEGSEEDRQGWREAPEIGKAQLKFYLAALSNGAVSVDPDNSLDAAGVPEELSYGDGFSYEGNDGVLTNLAVYNNSHFYSNDFDLDRLYSDFGGERPDAVIYINAGASWSEPGEDNGLFDLLLDAAEEGIGVLTVGDGSVGDARNIDPSRETFPVMGVQNWYRLKAFSDATIREFNFLEQTDFTVHPDFETPDVVHLRLDSVEGEERYRIALGEYQSALPADEDIIYEARMVQRPGGDGDQGHWDDSYYDPGDGKWFEYNTMEVLRRNDNIYSEDGNDVIINHANGEWSIYAKAVDVIEQDLYAPEMSAGVYNNHDVILGYDTLPGNERIYIVDETSWSSVADFGAELWIDGEILTRYGEALPGLESRSDLELYGEFTTVGGRDVFRFTRDYTVVSPYTDREILVIAEGRQIAGFSPGDPGEDLIWYNTDNPNEPTNYFGSYASGGYKDLQIVLFPDEYDDNATGQIFNNVFPSLAGESTLEFRDWEHTQDRTGRLRAAADIWAFNENLDLRSFEELFDQDAEFAKDAYYVNYLGKQVAGREGYPHFVTPPGSTDEEPLYPLPSDVDPVQFEFSYPASEKRHDLHGYDEDGKLYHAVSVVQTGQRRLGMLGFQPTYLKDVSTVMGMLEDITRWIAVDDWRYPDPQINFVYEGATEPADGRLVYTDVDEIELQVDFTVKGQDLRDSRYDAILKVTYNGETEELSIDNYTRNAGEEVDIHTFNLREAFDVDPTENDAQNISLNAYIEPTSPRFIRGKSEGSLTLRKLAPPSFDADDDQFEESIEVRISQTGDVDGNAVSDEVTIEVTDPKVDAGLSEFAYTLNQGGTVRAFASADRYLNSERNESSSFTQEATMPAPQADSTDGTLLFANDTVTLFVDLSSLDSEPDYEIEYTVTYDGTTVISTRGDRNESVEILLEGFIDRETRAVTDFTVTAKTIGIDDVWNDSREVTFDYSVRKLSTDPSQPVTIDFWEDAHTLEVAAVFDDVRFDEEIDGAYAHIRLGEDENSTERTKESIAHFDFDETESFTFVFWAEHPRYIHSDIVDNNEFVVEQRQLPDPVAAPSDDEANNRDAYHFYDPHDIRISLERDANYDDVAQGDFVIDIRGDIDGELLEKSANSLNITMDVINDLIDMGRGTRSLDFRGRTNPAEGVDYWISSDEQNYSYNFRTVDLDIAVVDGDEESDELGIVFSASDPVNNRQLTDGRIFYTYEGHDMSPNVLDTSDASTYSGSADHGEEITIPNGVILTAIGFRNGYVPNSPDEGTDIFIRDATLLISPEDRTAFGDALEVRVQSNLSPIHYEVYGETGQIDGNSGTIILDRGDPAPGDSVNVNFRAWVEGDDVTEGVEEERLYYRRMLPDVGITPSSGDYPGDIEVTMTNSAPAQERDIFYSFDGTPDRDDDLYEDPITVTPDIDVFGRAFVNPDVVESNGAGGWLPSNTEERNYRRVTTGVDEGSAYFDRSSSQDDLDADGIIDLAIVELADRWDDLALPDSVAAVFPGTSDILVVSDGITWEDSDDMDNKRIHVSLPFEERNTGFPTDEYITLYGAQYTGNVRVADSVAPVISRAWYLSGDFDLDGNRTADTLKVQFSEEVVSLTEGAPREDNLFFFGSLENPYTGDITFHDMSNDTVWFIVEDLSARMYPYQGDSLWIRTSSPVDIMDGAGNVQATELNRRVEMDVERLRINIRMDAFWILDNPDFSGVSSYTDIGTPVAGSDISVSLGGAIIIDPRVPFTEEQVLSSDFDAQVTILDEVGNTVVSTSGKDDDQSNIEVVPLMYDGRYVIAIAWDGTNRNGRQVHARSYKVHARTVWPGIDGSIRVNGVIPVMKDY